MCLASACCDDTTHAAAIPANDFESIRRPVVLLHAKGVNSQVTANLLLLKHQYGLGHRKCHLNQTRQIRCTYSVTV